MRLRQKPTKFGKYWKKYENLQFPERNKLSVDPLIYLLPDFLSSKELAFLDNFISENSSQFTPSFTEDNGERIISSERTSNVLPLKIHSKIEIGIREKCAELVGAEINYIESLQVAFIVVWIQC